MGQEHHKHDHEDHSCCHHEHCKTNTIPLPVETDVIITNVLRLRLVSL